MKTSSRLRMALACAFACCCLLLATGVCLAAESASPPPEARQRPRIGLVLGGGGARGGAHIGVIKVLEEMHIPIDYIVGTSMGSIVGGAYASGMPPDEMEKHLRGADWRRLLSDRLRREERSIYQKEVERKNIWSLEFGYRDHKLLLPRGALIGSQLDVFFARLVGLYHGRFDELVIPFRAVATDIGTGEMVVLDDGSLGDAMHASMSIPGAFAPFPIGDRLLVDGMLVRNLPVDVARSMGADIIIAVNVGSKLQPREKIRDVLSVTGQMVGILTEQNVRASMAQLGPGDVLVDVQAELGAFSTSDFLNAWVTIPHGVAAAQKVADKLRRYALPADAYRTHRAKQLSHYRVATSDKMRLDTAQLKYVNPKSVERTLGVESGVIVKEYRATLDADLRRLVVTDDFERLDFQYETIDGERVLVVEPKEKDWGPNYLRFGIDLSTDFKGQSGFDVLVNYRKTWLNARGLEWRSTLTLGRMTGVHSELYQPIDYARVFFVAPTFDLIRQRLDAYIGEKAVSTYFLQRSLIGLDAGVNLSTFAQVRLGYVAGREKANPEVALANFPRVEQTVSALRVRATYDSFDNLSFPRVGVHAGMSALYARQGMGSDADWQRVEARFDKAFSFGRHGLQLGVGGGSAMHSDLPAFEAFPLGGFLRLSGYGYQQFIGREYAFGRAIYTYALGHSQLLDNTIYVGGSLEAGNVYGRLNGPSSTGLKPAMSIFLAADTIIGPAYVALGFGDGGNYAAYVFLGTPY